MAKSRSKHQGNLYSQYKTEQRWAKNRRKRLEALSKVHPNNEQIKKALANVTYRRATPKAPQWSKTAIATAKLFKEFEAKFDMKELQKEHIIFNKESHYSGEGKEKEHKNPHGWYSLAARAHNKQGEFLWA